MRLSKFLAIVALLFLPLVAGAQLTVPQGGTGSTTLSGILYGISGNLRVQTLTVGSGLTFTGGTLSATGGGSSASSTLLSDTNTWTGTEDFTTNTGFNIAAPGQAVDILGKIRETSSLTDATNKAFFFLDRNFTNAQNDFLLAFGQSKTNGNTLIFGGGQTGFTAASSIAFFTGAGNNTDTGTSRLAIDATGNVSVANLTGGAVYTGPSGILLNTPTTTVTCAGTTSCSTFTIFGSSPVTITGSSGTSASSTLLGDTNTFSGTDIFSNTIKVASLSGFIGGNGGTLYNFATSTIKTSQLTNDANFLTANQTITLTGAVTGSGATAITTAFGTAGANTVLSNATGATAVPTFIATSSLFQNASASVSGLLTSTDWSTFNGKQAAGNYITALTGDVTASGPGSVAATLATVNSNVGTFTYPSVTVNGKGLVTAISNGTAPTTYTGTFPIAVTGSVISSLFSTTSNSGMAQGFQYIGSGGIFQSAASSSLFGFTPQPAGNYLTALTGDGTASGPGSAALTLATVNGNVGSFTNANITVNAKGLITAASNGTAGGVTSVTATYPLASSGGTTPNITTAFGTTTNNGIAAGSLYIGSGGIFQSTATGTISNGTGISVTAGQSVIGSGLTITNTGVTSNVAGTGISVSGATGAVTITNTGVTSLGNGTGTTCTGTAPGTCNVNTTQNITTLSNLTTAGTVNTTASGVLYTTGTSTITNGSGIAYSGTMGSEIGGVSGTLSVSGLSGTNFSNVAANTVFANGTGASAAPTFIATSTFFGTPTPGTILAFLNGQNTFVATTTFSSGLAYSAGNVTNTGVTSIVAGTNVTISGATGAVTINSTGGGGGTFPFTPINGTSVSTSSGLVITASSTIGGATQATGLTVAGGSTTTLNAYFNARVGIGDQSPDFTLESVGSNGNGYFGLSSSATGVEGDVFNVMSNGKVGIGSSTPYATLSINDIAGVDPFVIGSTTGGGPDPFFRVDQFGTTTVKTLQFADTGGNTLRWTMQETPSNDLSIFYPSIRRAVLINSGAGGGILAIGTTSEFGYTSFDVASNTPSMNLTDTDAGTNAKHFTFANNAGLFTIGSTSDAGIAGPPYFSIDGTKGGAVGIGTSTPTTVLTISNGINALGTLLINTWTNVTNAFTVKNAAGTTVFNIDTTATNPGLGVGATTTPWGTLSVTGDGTDPLFAVATTSNQGLPNFEIDVNGHEVTSGIKPTCTTNCTMLAGNDNAFRINTAAAVSSETVTFNKSWGVNAPICQATEGGNTASPIVIAASTTPTAVVLTNGSLSSKDIDVVCLGIQ